MMKKVLSIIQLLLLSIAGFSQVSFNGTVSYSTTPETAWDGMVADCVVSITGTAVAGGNGVYFAHSLQGLRIKTLKIRQKNISASQVPSNVITEISNNAHIDVSFDVYVNNSLINRYGQPSVSWATLQGLPNADGYKLSTKENGYKLYNSGAISIRNVKVKRVNYRVNQQYYDQIAKEIAGVGNKETPTQTQNPVKEGSSTNVSIGNSSTSSKASNGNPMSSSTTSNSATRNPNTETSSNKPGAQDIAAAEARKNQQIVQDAVDKNNQYAKEFNDRIDREQEKSRISAQLAQESYYTAQAVENAENNVSDNMNLSGNYTTPEELEAEFNRKQAALNRSISELAEAQNQNLQANFNTYSPYRDANTEAIGQLAVGAINLINQAQVAREKREAQERLERQKSEALAAMAQQKKAMLMALRKSLFAQFPEGGVPLSSKKIATNELFYFAYIFDKSTIEESRPQIKLLNVFPVARYGDGTWPFKSALLGEINKFKQSGAATIVGYYSSKSMAEGMRASFVRMASSSQMYTEDLAYKGKPASSSTSSSTTDYWGNAKKETGQPTGAEQQALKTNSKVDFWGNPIQPDNTQQAVVTEINEVAPTQDKPAVKFDFWGNPIK